ncbi:hypothetical protein [Psychrobacter sp. K31L]|uniref:hypothetical protein n=1 Tax=Psychrobacter sp. K31L TaxID=2820758 RepID=UPI001B32C8EC|nr:hypothetical protein [Psychrobacter sp. K31L]MBP3947039.1 hypothetical protein [Psychrobacter sp. K31L]
MSNFAKILIISSSVLIASCGNASVNKTVSSIQTNNSDPMMTIFLHDEHYYEALEAEDPSYLDAEPQIIIQPLSDVVCTNEKSSDYKFVGSQCALSREVSLPEKIEFRYGKWLSVDEERRQFPPIPDEEYTNEPLLVDNYESRAAFEKAKDHFYEQLFSIPKYKAMREAKRTSKDAIDWHTYTIYPQKIMQKYDKEHSTHPMSTSEVTIVLTFHDDLSITISDNLKYLNASHP